MTGGVSIPLHLAVHVLGLTVAAGLAAYGLARRRGAGSAWPGLVVGGGLLAVSHVATGALLTGDLAWPVYLRAAGYAGIAVGAAGRLVGLGVVVAVAPPAAHIAAGVAGAAAAVASARGVLGRGRASLPLAAGLALWAAGDLVSRTDATWAAVLSLAGSAAAGGWLLLRARRSLYAQVVGAFTAVLLVLVIALAAASGVIFSLDIERDQLQTLETQAAARALQFTDEWPGELRRLATPLAGDRLAAELADVSQGERAGLDGRAASIAAFPGVDVAVLLTRDGQVAGSADPRRGEPGPLPAADEAAIAGAELIAPSYQGADATGLLAFGEEQLLAIGAVPVAPRQDGQLALDQQSGVLVLGRRITDPGVVADIAEAGAAEATILVSGSDAASSLGAEDSQAVAEAVASGARSQVTTVRGDRRFVTAVPLRDDDGAMLGQLVLTLDATTLAGAEEDAARTLFLAGVAGLLVAGLLAGVLSSRTTRPVRDLTAAAERVAAGDFDVQLGTERRDEVGRLALAFDDMATSLSEREEALRRAATTEAELRHRLEVITGSMGEALVAVDRDGTITTANPAAAALLGREREELLGTDIARQLLGYEVGGEPLLAALGGASHRGTAAARGSIVRGRTGTPVAATAAPLTDDDGALLGRVYVLRDVTGEVEAERMKTEFLSNISHELRTPLTPIKGYAEVLRNRELDHVRVVDFAGNISLAAQRLERIIGMLVDFAALEAGRMEVDIVPTDVSDVVDDVLEDWRNRHPDRKFVRRIARDLDHVFVDPRLLHRVLEELIDNAVKFSDDTISILGRWGDEGTVDLIIRDRGEGIDDEALEQIHEDFRQVDGSATRRFGGLGLGLSIVMRILERFNADVTVRSEEGEGTDVVVHLPPEER
ncbi:MAG: ATP-binding protein [Nitriliruptorales bacterium]|nr:ATP-binding protein [Nitriliruptorales bacterium]